MTRRDLASAVLVASTSAVILASCGTRDGPSSVPMSTRETESPALSQPRRPATPSEKEEQSKSIEITVGGQRFRATLEDSAASRDLLAQLPQTVEMEDHGGVEKTGPLRSALSLDGQPPGADPNVGDVGYYAPGNDLVLYYGDQSYHEGIVILGQLDGDASHGIAQMEGDVTISVHSVG